LLSASLEAKRRVSRNEEKANFVNWLPSNPVVKGKKNPGNSRLPGLFLARRSLIGFVGF
jgi:hypothetical protein